VLNDNIPKSRSMDDSALWLINNKLEIWVRSICPIVNHCVKLVQIISQMFFKFKTCPPGSLTFSGVKISKIKIVHAECRIK